MNDRLKENFTWYSSRRDTYRLVHRPGTRVKIHAIGEDDEENFKRRGRLRLQHGVVGPSGLWRHLGARSNQLLEGWITLESGLQVFFKSVIVSRLDRPPKKYIIYNKRRYD